MDPKTILVLTIASLDILLGLVVFLQDRRSSINRAYSFFAMSVSMWGFGVGFFLMSNQQEYANFLARLLYFGGGLIPAAFYYFSLVFYSERPISFLLRFIIFLPSILFFILYFFTDAIISGTQTIGGATKGFIYGPFRYLFDLHLWVIFMLALKELIIKFKSTPKSQLRSHTLFIIFGTYSVLTVAAVTNIIAPIFSVFSLIWIGPSATIIWIAIVTFAVIKHQLFNMRIIATQLFIFVLWVFLLIRALLSVGKSEAIINGILFAIVITLGVFLIRSVIKEVETREKVEKLASDLKMANTRLQELDRQKSEFVSIASHQLKAPLTAIKGYASMLLDGSFGELSGVVRDVANRIFKSSQGMVNVVEDFLNITRIEQGRMGYDIGKTDLAIIVRDVLSELQSTISASGLDLEMNIPNTPVMVLADGGKIKQVVLNLIDNALKYTPKGSVHVALLRKEGKAIFSVRDSGIGISQSFAMRMFGKFNRAENGMRLHANGSGIGLYLAKEILKAHKGRIWAESEGEGKGSTFFVELPVCA